MNVAVRIAPVRKSIRVAASQAHAFEVFTAGLGRWWPLEHGIGFVGAVGRTQERGAARCAQRGGAGPRYGVDAELAEPAVEVGRPAGQADARVHEPARAQKTSKYSRCSQSVTWDKNRPISDSFSLMT